MRIAVFTDAHANLPALQAALASIQRDGCDAIYHTGDAIAIGPYPAECLDLLLSTPRIQFVMGNHDSYFAGGLPEERPAWMEEDEFVHTRWTHAQLNPGLRAVVAGWPYSLTKDLEGTRAVFQHYGRDESGQDFRPVIKNPTAQDLDSLFGIEEASLVFYGHHHRQADIRGKARYLNAGALGCYDRPEARYYLVDFGAQGCTVEHRQVPYDDTGLRQAYFDRQVPARDFIFRAFFGGRF